MATVEQQKFHGCGIISCSLNLLSPTVTPVFCTMVPIPADAQVLKSGSDHAQAFAPPVNGGFQPSPLTDLNANDSSSIGRRPSTKEQCGQMNPSLNTQWPAASNNFHLQQTMGLSQDLHFLVVQALLMGQISLVYQELSITILLLLQALLECLTRHFQFHIL